jgi:hypothetical protein
MNMATKRHQLAIQARLLAALPINSSIRQKLEMCGTESPGYFWTCRQPACFHCRRRYVRRQFNVARARFAGCTKTDMAFVSVVLDGTSDVAQVGDIIKRARATTRNLFGKHRALRRRWHGAQLLGWFEVDALCAEDAPLLGNERAALMADMGVTLAPAQPTYIPTIHAVVALNGLDWQEMRDAFQEKWPHEHQVDVRPFYEHQPVEKSLYCTIRYALKRSCSSFLRGADAEWPESWLVEFETWSQRWSRSFQSFRISIGKKRTPKLISTPKYTSIDEDNYIEPMPMVF